MARKALLICGILSSFLYAGADFLAATRYEGYSYTARTVSELSAIGAPTRPLLVPLYGKWFRLYSIATLVTVLVFGTLAGLDGPRVAANQPTPWVGMTERINIGAYLLWVLALAVTAWRARGSAVPDQDAGRSDSGRVARPAA